MITPEFRDGAVQTTNMRAAMQGAGTRIYPGFVPFDTAEVDAVLGLILANGLHPWPQLQWSLKSQADDWLYGNDALHRRFPRGDTRLKEFR